MVRFSCRLLVDHRSYTTAKADAFAAPSIFVDFQKYSGGSNDLGPYEAVLAQAYEDLGRPDLAAYVRNGKKFQRLYDKLDGGFCDFPDLNATRRAFLDLPDHIPQPSHMDEWVVEATARHRADDPWINEAIKIHNAS